MEELTVSLSLSLSSLPRLRILRLVDGSRGYNVVALHLRKPEYDREQE